jgi:hypothetical protein
MQRRPPPSHQKDRLQPSSSGKENDEPEETYDRFAFDHSSEDVESEPELLEADDDDMFR